MCTHVIRLAGVHAVRPARHVDGGVGQRLVHRDERVAEPADALLVAERLPSAWPSTIAVSSMVWWPSISTSPLARTVRSKLAWLPSAVSMWS